METGITVGQHFMPMGSRGKIPFGGACMGICYKDQELREESGPQNLQVIHFHKKKKLPKIWKTQKLSISFAHFCANTM